MTGDALPSPGKVRHPVAHDDGSEKILFQGGEMS
jgi:hypothetical protein